MTIRLAYLCGEYPRATDTFIQREVAALRRAGLDVTTLSVRRPAAAEQGTAEQEQERRNTHYLLPCPPWRLVAVHAGLLLGTPRRYWRAVKTAWTIRSPGWRALLYQLFYFAEAGLVVHKMRRLGISHLHNHTPNASGYVAMIAAALGPVTYSMTLHGFGIFAEPTRWRLTEKIERALFTVCVSRHARSQAMLWSDPRHWQRLHVIHCGIDTADLPERRHAGRGKHLLFVGRFDHVKGLPLLVEIFATLAGKIPALCLHLVGDGPQRALIESLVREKGLAEQVRFYGYQSQGQLLDHFARADLFVMTSFAEGIPVVLMEAMAHGVPVVAPRITGIPELVIDGVSGLLATPGHAESFVEQIATLLDDPDARNRMAAAGRHVVAQAFDLETEAGRLAKILRQHLR